jgi:drug/metabolite transporter (DMT)-like permease
MPALKIAILTAITMFAVAANSVLARLALSDGDIDPLAYTGIRITSGALILAIIFRLRSRKDFAGKFWIAGTWSGAFSLLLYAVTFSIAYVMVGAGPGALILFASVQIAMIAWAIVKGDRQAPLEWIGLCIAFGSLVYLLSPGLVAPSLTGALLMAVAGVSWGAYCLIGRGSRFPLADTAGNFIRCAPFGVVLIGFGAALSHPSAKGIAYALASGALASALGYIIWYSVLPSLSRTRAALVQLTVPPLAAMGGVFLIGEMLTWRLLIATAGIIGGVALALIASERRAPQ